MQSSSFWQFVRRADRDRAVEDRKLLLSGAIPIIDYEVRMLCRDRGDRRV
jgi:hypothetical protein